MRSIRSKKGKPHAGSKPCRLCGRWWTPGGMPCYSCMCDIFTNQPAGTTDRQNREAKAHAGKARRNGVLDSEYLTSSMC